MAKKRIKKHKLPVPRSISRLFPNVKFVEESDKYVSVKVSKNDCDHAKSMDPTNCAMARAVKKEFHADAAIIGLSFSYIIKGNKAVRFQTPVATRQEIVSFDRHHDFEPGEYYLKPASESMRLGSEKHRSGGEKKSGASHQPKRALHKTARVRQLPSGTDFEA